MLNVITLRMTIYLLLCRMPNMLSVVKLSVVMKNAIMLNVVMLSAVMLNVIVLSVVAPLSLLA